jgi:hypothetical protein
MCWSLEASAAFTITGVAAGAYAVATKRSPGLYIPLFYFTAMEALQVLQYTVIDQCGLPFNQFLTYIGYLHISLQPFFLNMLALYFIPPHIARRIRVYVYAACVLASISMLVQLYPSMLFGTCRLGSMLCGGILCTVSGGFHIAWKIPLNGMYNLLFTELGISMPGYLIAGLILPFIYGSWRVAIYQIVFGIYLASQLSNDANEIPAIWCLFSVALIALVTFDKPLARYFHVRQWPLWKWWQ